MPENSTHKCTNAVNNVQPIRNSSHTAKILSVYNRLQAGDYENGNGGKRRLSRLTQFIHATLQLVKTRRWLTNVLKKWSRKVVSFVPLSWNWQQMKTYGCGSCGTPCVENVVFRSSSLSYRCGQLCRVTVWCVLVRLWRPHMSCG